jgi:hypothetical protein
MRLMEEAKREIVEGPNFKRKDEKNRAMVIESDSDRLPNPVSIGKSNQEIDAFYNNLIAEFGEKRNPKHIDYEYTHGKMD